MCIVMLCFVLSFNVQLYFLHENGKSKKLRRNVFGQNTLEGNNTYCQMILISYFLSFPFVPLWTICEYKYNDITHEPN